MCLKRLCGAVGTFLILLDNLFSLMQVLFFISAFVLVKSGTEVLIAGLRALITDWVIRHPAVHPYVNLLTINQKETGRLLSKV